MKKYKYYEDDLSIKKQLNYNITSFLEGWQVIVNLRNDFVIFLKNLLRGGDKNNIHIHKELK